MAINFIYATTGTGQKVKIPLEGDPPSTVDILGRLIAKGIPIGEIHNVAFSCREPRGPTPFTVDERQSMDAIPSTMPPFPEPNEYLMLPGFSEVLTKASVTLKELNEQGRSYRMRKPGENYWVDVLSLPEGDFVNKSDYQKIHDGAVTLNTGKIWKLADQQNIPPSMDRYQTVMVYRSGISKETTLEIEVTLGYEGYGASASLRALFRQTFTVTEETEHSETFTFDGTEGIVKIFGLWQECDIFTVEVDGQRMDNPVYSLPLLSWTTGKSTPYMVIDHFDGTLNVMDRTQGDLKTRPSDGS